MPWMIDVDTFGWNAHSISASPLGSLIHLRRPVDSARIIRAPSVVKRVLPKRHSPPVSVRPVAASTTRYWAGPNVPPRFNPWLPTNTYRESGEIWHSALDTG